MGKKKHQDQEKEPLNPKVLLRIHAAVDEMHPDVVRYYGNRNAVIEVMSARIERKQHRTPVDVLIDQVRRGVINEAIQGAKFEDEERPDPRIDGQFYLPRDRFSRVWGSDAARFDPRDQDEESRGPKREVA